jgi:hypothetical protein
MLRNIRLLPLLLIAFAGTRAYGIDTAEPPVHGLWIWSGPEVLSEAQSIRGIRGFCQSEGINEIYVSVPSPYDALQALRLSQLITHMHQSSIRVEALISSTDADEPGAPRTRLLDHVQAIVQFNRDHAMQRFDGIHLDIEPQQRPENKGPGNLEFLPGLITTYRAVRVLADRAGLTLNADIQSKVLEADLTQRRELLRSAPRFTLMLYELDRPGDGRSSAQQIDKLRDASHRFLEMAYQGLDDPKLAHLSVALRTADYGAQLPQMLGLLDQENNSNPHYLGWARHSYNDTLPGVGADRR